MPSAMACAVLVLSVVTFFKSDKTKTAQAIADGIKDYLKQAGLY